MNFLKKNQSNCIQRNNVVKKKLFSTIVLPLFLLILAVVTVGSGCTAEPGFTYDVVFSSPIKDDIYYTDRLNDAGVSLGPKKVEIEVEVTSRINAIRELVIQIRENNDAGTLVTSEVFTMEPDIYNYSLSWEFSTDIADKYRIVLISYYVGKGESNYQDGTSFEYQDPQSGGPTDN